MRLSVQTTGLQGLQTSVCGVSPGMLCDAFFLQTRLIKMLDPATDRPLFASRSIELACERCKEEGKAESCVHLLHLVPSWQSAERHRKLKVIMQDRPDLIQSELAGLAFDSLQQVFRKVDLSIAFDSPCLPLILNQSIWMVIDPAAGGPASDYAIVSIVRNKGCVTVSLRQHPALLAPRNETLLAAAVVNEKIDHKVVFEIDQKAFQFRCIGWHLAHQNRVLQIFVHIQKQQKNNQQVVAAARR